MACRSVAAVLLAVVASVATVVLQGCGSEDETETKPPTHTGHFQKLGTGACRTADDNEGLFGCVVPNIDADECRNICLGDATCVALQTSMGDRVCTCEIHRKTITKVELEDHPNETCYRRINFEPLQGACRTADGGEGESTCADTKLNAVECRDLCLGDPECVAYETTTEDRDCTCEIHKTAITKAEPTDHKLHECHILEPVINSFFQELGTGACRTADDNEGEFTCLPNPDTLSDCANSCLSRETCFAYETTTELDRDCTCQLHSETITKVEPKDHSKHKCYRRINFKTLGPFGACRTADDGEGDFTCADSKLNADECRDRCLGDPECVAYETTTEDRDCTCEIHKTAITKVEQTDHKLHECHILEPVIKATAASYM